MKKLFLALLCAGLFFACGNKKTAEEPAVDSTACVTEQVCDEAEPEVVAEPEVAEAPAQQPKASTTTTKPKQTVQQHAQEAAEQVANTAIDEAASSATQAVQSKKRR